MNKVPPILADVPPIRHDVPPVLADVLLILADVPPILADVPPILDDVPPIPDIEDCSVPSVLQVHRIINHVQYGNKQFDYLVKWKELVYEQATWERDDFDIPGFEDCVFRYWIHRYAFSTSDKSLSFQKP